MRVKLCIFGIGLLVLTLTASGQSRNGTRPIIDVHFHALSFNSFGLPAPPNEITGVAPRAKSNQEAAEMMVAALKHTGIVKGSPHETDYIGC